MHDEVLQSLQGSSVAGRRVVCGGRGTFIKYARLEAGKMVAGILNQVESGLTVWGHLVYRYRT